MILRFESGGGLLPFGYFATQAPAFTLYGDDSVIFRPSTDPGGTGNELFVRAILTAAQVDTLLSFALTTGHLATALETYSVKDVADGSTTYFTINAGGVHKIVSAYALGQSIDLSGPQAADYQAFLQLGALLGNFDKEVSQGHVVSSGPYVPATYRAILVDAQVTTGARVWPWPDLAITAFQMDARTAARRIGVITAEQASRVTSVPSGGVIGVAITAPDGTTPFSLSLRPLLPGDTLEPASDPAVPH